MSTLSLCQGLSSSIFITRKTEMAQQLVHGIDFSGDVQKWTPGCGRSNVWVATAEWDANRLELIALRRVQELPGEDHPFSRLVHLLAGADYLAAAIDAPFALPTRHMPAGGLPALLEAVKSFEAEGRPFAKAEQLVSYAENIAPKKEKKPMRATENVWRSRGINTVRSTLFGRCKNERRGGAPFTTACLTLLAKAKRPVWPWSKVGPGLLVEAFPAGQLRCWELPHRGYDGPEKAMVRCEILRGIEQRIVLPEPLRFLCQESADALDAVLCLFAAVAAVSDIAPFENPASGKTEGWIAVHPL